MASTAREASAQHLRTGRRMPPSAFAPPPVELKFKATHDPENGQFTSGPSGTGADGQPDGSGTEQPGASTVGSARPNAALLRAAEIAERAASGRHSTGDCYKYVKRALLRSGAVSDYLPSIPAKDAGVDLAERGFVNLLTETGVEIGSPYDAPVGSVLVYDPTPDSKDRRYGHIEFRTKTGFASDYVSRTARTGPKANGRSGRQRVLIGVWVKR